jgi:hypothetical protein
MFQIHTHKPHEWRDDDRSITKSATACPLSDVGRETSWGNQNFTYDFSNPMKVVAWIPDNSQSYGQYLHGFLCP